MSVYPPGSALEAARRRLLERISDEQWAREGGGVTPEQIDAALRAFEANLPRNFRRWPRC